jgi:hypothetical protein
MNHGIKEWVSEWEWKWRKYKKKAERVVDGEEKKQHTIKRPNIKWEKKPRAKLKGTLVEVKKKIEKKGRKENKNEKYSANLLYIAT